MNEIKKSCASTDRAVNDWDSINWLNCEVAVQKLQARIVKGSKRRSPGQSESFAVDIDPFVLR